MLLSPLKTMPFLVGWGLALLGPGVAGNIITKNTRTPPYRPGVSGLAYTLSIQPRLPSQGGARGQILLSICHPAGPGLGT